MIPFVTKLATALLFAVCFFGSSTLAGPPLICHAFDIGNAKSLPWISHDWNLTGSETYDVNHLASDTISILDSDPSVLVHMETLRRATLYAQKDSVVAKRLLLAMMARSSAAADTPKTALANFDLGYLAATFQQYARISKSGNDPAQNCDGYTLIKRAIVLRGNDPQMEFAAALITLNTSGSEQSEHARKALTGSKSDPLLARNLAAHFRGPQSEIMAELITANSSAKVAQR